MLLIICIAETPTRPLSSADVCSAPRCTNPPRLGSFHPKKCYPPNQMETTQTRASHRCTMLSAQPQKLLSTRYRQEGWLGGNICSVDFTCSCCETGGTWEPGQGRAVTAVRARGDRGQDKTPAPCTCGGTLSWGCSLQGAICRSQAVPGAEPAAQGPAQR